MQEGSDPTLVLLSQRLRRLRQDNGLRLSDLGRLTGLSEAYLYRVEVGERFPSLPSLINLSKAFKVSLAELLAEPSPGPLRHSTQAPRYGVDPRVSAPGS